MNPDLKFNPNKNRHTINLNTASNKYLREAMNYFIAFHSETPTASFIITEALKEYVEKLKKNLDNLNEEFININSKDIDGKKLFEELRKRNNANE